ncbi:MAG: DUF1499 domain-containing protein [Spirochaetales bacterium]
MLSLLESRPSCRIVTAESDYVHVVLRSHVLRLRSEEKFHLPDTEPNGDFRAASLVGHDDIGMHRNRMHEITVAFETDVSARAATPEMVARPL